MLKSERYTRVGNLKKYADEAMMTQIGNLSLLPFGPPETVEKTYKTFKLFLFSIDRKKPTISYLTK